MKDLIFDVKELKLIFNAVRYYQMNRVPLNSKDYQICDGILNKIFPMAKDVPFTGVSTSKHGGDLDAL